MIVFGCMKDQEQHNKNLGEPQHRKVVNFKMVTKHQNEAKIITLETKTWSSFLALKNSLQPFEMKIPKHFFYLLILSMLNLQYYLAT